MSEHELLSSEKLQELHNPEALNARVLNFPLLCTAMDRKLPFLGRATSSPSVGPGDF